MFYLHRACLLTRLLRDDTIRRHLNIFFQLFLIWSALSLNFFFCQCCLLYITVYVGAIRISNFQTPIGVIKKKEGKFDQHPPGMSTQN